MKLLERVGRKHRERALKDPALLAKATPDYTVGCKRILPSNDWYPALARENVELVTDGVAEVRPNSVVLTDGRELEVDALVFGTGFHVLDMPVGRLVRGRDGRTLADVWDGSPRAHLGVTVPGFPNFFILLGPNTGPRPHVGRLHDRVADRLRARRAAGHARPRRRRGRGAPEVEERFHAEVQRRMQGTVWNTGCKSWYQDAQGNNPTLWPDWTWRYRQRTARFNARGVRDRVRSGSSSPARPAGSAARRSSCCAPAARRSSASTCRARTSSATCATRPRSTAPWPRRSSASAASTC